MSDIDWTRLRLAAKAEGSAQPPDNLRLYRYSERLGGWLVGHDWEFVGELPEGVEVQTS